MKVAPAILKILDAATLDGRALRLPAGQIERNAYLAVNKVIEAAGGKWDRKAKAHLFEVFAEDAIDQIIATGEVTPKRQELQQFWTPPALADRIAALAEIRPDHRVYEPSAGKGALIRAALRFAPLAHISAVEIDATLHRALEREFFTAADSLGCQRADFLALRPIRVFDRILMNPPFARQADIRHVAHALRFLKPGGRMVAILSAGVLSRDNRLTADFRTDIALAGGRFELLPDGSFRESGTMVHACLLVAGARADG